MTKIGVKKVIMTLEVLIPYDMEDHIQEMNLEEILECSHDENGFSIIERDRYIVKCDEPDEVQWACQKHGITLERFYTDEQVEKFFTGNNVQNPN